jgi:membrane protein YqaA with SNARE-associated domain
MLDLVVLFASALLAGTFFPFPSEATLVGLLYLDRVAAGALWLAATAGNTLGSMVNWALGRFALRFQDHPRFPVRRTRLARAQRWFNRFGVWTLLLAWLPLVGTGLALVAGLMRTPFLLSLVLVGIGKGARYAVVVWLAG